MSLLASCHLEKESKTYFGIKTLKSEYSFTGNPTTMTMLSFSQIRSKIFPYDLSSEVLTVTIFSFTNGVIRCCLIVVRMS